MEVMVRGRRVSLSADDTLGDGGEATVVRHGDLALKLYHRPSAVRTAKLERLIAIAGALPPAVVAPRELVCDARGKRVVGFAMRALAPDHEVVAALSRRRARATSGIRTGDVAALFLAAHDCLAAIHRAGAVVGDLNDMNETFSRRRGALDMAWIDVDSFQIPGFPCEVATEAFLDPALYGPDLAQPVTTGSGPRIFLPENDWYAFAVLLFRSLTLVHPYGGTDPDLPTLPRRAAARRSVFSPSVRYPRTVGFALEILSDDLAAQFRAVFERGARSVFPRATLEAYVAGLVPCRACGAEHPRERSQCPACAALAPTPAVTSTSECAVTDLLEARGEIVAIAASPSTLRAVAIEEGEVVLYALAGPSPRRIVIGAARATLAIELSAGMLAIVEPRGPGAALAVYPLIGDSVGAAIRTTTERFAGGRAAFACSGASLYRIAGGVLLRGSFEGGVFEERPLTTVMREQTQVFADRSGSLLLGYSRAFNERQFFLVAGRRRIEIAVPGLEPGESLVGETALFSARTVAYLRRTRFGGGGGDRVRTLVYADDGALLAGYLAPISSRASAGGIDGGVSSGRSLLFPTDRGIARERFGTPSDPTPASHDLFAATEPFVGREALLCALPDGGLGVAHGARVRRLSIG